MRLVRCSFAVFGLGVIAVFIATKPQRNPLNWPFLRGEIYPMRGVPYLAITAYSSGFHKCLVPPILLGGGSF